MTDQAGIAPGFDQTVNNGQYPSWA